MQDISASRFVDVDGGIDGNLGADRVDRSGLALKHEGQFGRALGGASAAHEVQGVDEVAEAAQRRRESPAVGGGQAKGIPFHPEAFTARGQRRPGAGQAILVFGHGKEGQRRLGQGGLSLVVSG